MKTFVVTLVFVTLVIFGVGCDRSSKEIGDSGEVKGGDNERKFSTRTSEAPRGDIVEQSAPGRAVLQKNADRYFSELSGGGEDLRNPKKIKDLKNKINLIIHFSDQSANQDKLILINDLLTGAAYESAIDDLFKKISMDDPLDGLSLAQNIRPGKAREAAFYDIAKRLPFTQKNGEVVGSLLKNEGLLKEDEAAILLGIRAQKSLAELNGGDSGDLTGYLAAIGQSDFLDNLNQDSE